MGYKCTGRPAGRRATCGCKTCKKCKHREYVKQWREKKNNA